MQTQPPNRKALLFDLASPFRHGKRRLLGILSVIGLSLIIAAPLAHATDYTMKADDPSNTSSYNWSDLIARASLRLCVCAILLALSQALREGTNPHVDQLVVAAKDLLKRNVDPPIGISDLVKHIGSGRTRLFQLFR